MWLCLHTCFLSYSTRGSTNTAPDSASASQSCGIGKTNPTVRLQESPGILLLDSSAWRAAAPKPHNGKGKWDWSNPWGKRRFRLCLKLNHLDLLPSPSSSPGKGGTSVEKELWPHNQPIPHLQSRRRVLNSPSSFFIKKSSSNLQLRGSMVTKSIQNSHLQIYSSVTFSPHNRELLVQELGGWTRQGVNPVKHNPFTSREAVGIIPASSAALASRNFRKRKSTSKFVDNSRKPLSLDLLAALELLWWKVGEKLQVRVCKRSG